MLFVWISPVMVVNGGFGRDNKLWLTQKCYLHFPDRQKTKFFYAQVINMAVKRLSPKLYRNAVFTNAGSDQSIP